MALIDTVMATLHLVVGGLWTGSVLFFALAVLPTPAPGTSAPPRSNRSSRA